MTPSPTNTARFGPAPRGDCREPGVTSVLVKDAAGNANDRLTWKWLKGAQTPIPDFGDPVLMGGTSYGVYDYSGGTPSLVMTATIPPAGNCAGKPCWVAKGTSQFKYTDRAGSAGGITQLRLKAGAMFRAAIKLKAGGVQLSLPAPVSSAQFFQQDGKVTVQLVNSIGNCWGSEFTPPARSNDGSRFKDKEL